eukprot:gene3253-7377_t
MHGSTYTSTEKDVAAALCAQERYLQDNGAAGRGGAEVSEHLARLQLPSEERAGQVHFILCASRRLSATARFAAVQLFQSKVGKAAYW